MVVHNNNIPGSFGTNNTIGSEAVSSTAVQTESNASQAQAAEREAQLSPEETEKRRQEALIRREEERENVIARSDDGDTLQVEPEAADIIDEDIGAVNATGDDVSAVYAEREESIEAPELEAAEPVVTEEPAEGAEAVLEAEIKVPDTETTAEQIAEEDASRFDDAVTQQTSSTYAGISDMSLEQMYLDGKISRYDYDTEMEARKDARKQLETDNRKAVEDINNADKEKRESERSADAIRTATSERTANQDFAVSAADRLEAIENLNKGNEKATEQQKREEDNARVWQFQQSLA